MRRSRLTPTAELPMFPSLKAFLAHYQARTNKLLETLLDRADAPVPLNSLAAPNQLSEAMRYSLLSDGKRIRPILVYASAHAAGSVTTGTDKCACAVEAIHAYSLIHDDLPAMDDDELRRGKPTCHVKFNEATAILAGDALQCLAFEWLVHPEGLADDMAIQAVRVLAKAAGARGMVLGQAIDLAAVNQPLTIDALEHMHSHKTGALIEASVVLGALSAAASPAAVANLRKYARAIGLAFQVQDDILDVISNTEILGKTQGADVKHNKPTYVSLLGLDGAKQKADDLHRIALDALDGLHSSADPLRWLASYIIERKY